MLRGEKGITLIALIITIIILIILAAVTITSLTNDNFVGTAMNGTKNYANAQGYESMLIDKTYDSFSSVVSDIESRQSDWSSLTLVAEEKDTETITKTTIDGTETETTTTVKAPTGNWVMSKITP